MKHEYMPVSVSMRDRPCLVVGGGAVALRKVENLLDYEAQITLVAPDVIEKLEYHARREQVTLEKREYRSPEAAEYGVVISATDDTALNQRVYDDARSGGALVNVVDDPPRCDFIFPAVLRRDCLTAALSTDGKAPFMAGHLRVILENIFPAHWKRLMQLATDFRTKVRDRWGDDTEKKNRCYAEFLEADWKRVLKEMKDPEIAEKLTQLVEFPEKP